MSLSFFLSLLFDSSVIQWKRSAFGTWALATVDTPNTAFYRCMHVAYTAYGIHGAYNKHIIIALCSGRRQKPPLSYAPNVIADWVTRFGVSWLEHVKIHDDNIKRKLRSVRVSVNKHILNGYTTKNRIYVLSFRNFIIFSMDRFFSSSFSFSLSSSPCADLCVYVCLFTHKNMAQIIYTCLASILFLFWPDSIRTIEFQASQPIFPAINFE